MAVLTPLQIKNLIEQAKQSKGLIPQSVLTQLLNLLQCDINTLLQALLPVATSFSQAPISEFNVGAIVYDETTGNAYCGANLEFAHQALNLTVHAEQAAINNAWLNGAQSISIIAITAPPCGHCRQFMNEISGADTLKVVLPSLETDLKTLLPHSFGPEDLGNEFCLLTSNSHDKVALPEQVSRELAKQFMLAYAPYSKNPAAVEIKTVSHGNFYGRYAENAAYNPSLSPMQSALSQLALAGLTLNCVELVSITLVETESDQNQKAVAVAVLDSHHCKTQLNHIRVK
jgi:cytidine deaminase